MKPAAATALLAMAMTVPAIAQVSPFDMSPERTVPAAPAPQQPAASAAPAPPPAAVAPAEPAAPPSLARPETPSIPAGTPVQEVQAAGASPEPARRYIIPFGKLVLSGEYDKRSWSIYLTPEQAAAKTTLTLAYRNAIVVAPEVSNLRLTINGTQLANAPIAAPQDASGLTVEVPAGLLNAGMNDVSIEAIQRHRTDCTVESTYELWTQVEPEGTYLSFEGDRAARWTRVDDIRAIGADQSGLTRFNVTLPGGEQATTTPVVIRLAQSLALMANMPNQSFSVSETARPARGPGEANVVAGTASELAGVLAALPPGSETGPTAAVVDDLKLGPSTLVVTGPTWQAVEAAVDGLGQQVDRPVGAQRSSLQTRLWRTPDVPMVFGATWLKFADLGVNTLEFSGRRVRTDFAVGVPADFYATAYGEATILLDAAYSPEVLPGSHIDIYVNDNIAATVPITTAGGEILRHLPIKVTMRHFRPGENVIAVEAVLKTEADRLCAPGATALANSRFVVFDSSEFVMHDFARIARTPELASLGGTAFPYNRVEYPIPVVLDRSQPDALSAATTLLARMAVAASRLIPVDTNASVASIADKDAIFVNTISQVPPAVLAQVGVSDESRSGWGETVASVKPDTQVTFDQWRERLRGSGWRGQVSRFEEWLNRTFNVSMETFRIFHGEQPAFTPGGNASVLVASNHSPSGTGSWTLISAPTVGALKEGIEELTAYANWRQMGGHITTLNPATNRVSRIPTEDSEFIETVPFSFKNYRLIAANWFSSNALSYGMALTALSITLGLATAGLLGAFGRKD